MRRPNKAGLGGAAALIALAAWLPARGQNAPQSILPPGFDAPAGPAAPASPAPSRAPEPLLPSTPTAPVAAPAPPVAATPGADEAVAESNGATPADQALADLDLSGQEAVPEQALRSLDLVGGEPVYGQDAFGDGDGRYLAALMRRLQAPIASRWAEIVLRRMLLGATPSPAGEGQADWVADRASLLLRLGESNAARQLVAGVDVENFSPRLRHVAIQSALASADPAALCPLPDGPERVNGLAAWPMIRAMCATLSGDEATANATIGRAPPGDPVDHALAEKLVAAGGGGRRNVQIEWAAVDTLTDWRFGLASALGVLIPQALLDQAASWFQAWLAQAPMLSAADRIAPARVAAALGPVSNADLVDLYGRVLDESGDDADSPSARLHAAYRGDDDDARLSALHALWDAPAGGAAGERDRYAAAVLTARAATSIAPDRHHRDDIALLTEAMFAGGFDRQAARWAGVVANTDSREGDRAWAMLAVGAERPVVATDVGRVQAFAKRAGDEGRHRTAMLAAALAGLGRLDGGQAATIASAAGFDLARPSGYARALAQAVDGRAPGTVALLAAVGLQSPRWTGVVPADFYRLLSALRAVGLDGEARMIAAEAMARL